MGITTHLPPLGAPDCDTTVLNVAITGNAASGKSTVARWFRSWGATLIDSDAIVAELQEPHSTMLRALASEFGNQIILPDGSLDRSELRRLAFENSDSTARLNSIIHPAVKSRRTELFAQASRRGDRIVVSEIPLLFEVLDPGDFDFIVLVESPKALRHKRLLDRGLESEEACNLMASQMPSEQKRARANIVIENSGSIEDLRREAEEAWDVICGRLDT